MNPYKVRTVLFYICIIIIVFSTSASAQEGNSLLNKSLPEKALLHTAYLIGDSGELDSNNPPENIVFSAIKARINYEENAAFYFLGDNIYPDGLRDTSLDYRNDLDIINAHIDLAETIDNKSYMIPGNHDWRSTTESYNSMAALTEYLDIHSTKLKLKPKNGCPDPYVLKISKDHIFLIMDSQWWMDNKEGDALNYGDCDIESRHGLALNLEKLFIKHKNDQITVMMHHPLLSNGNHGGNFSFKQHVFPLTDISPNLYIPMPIIGSILPFYRNLGTNKQDVSYFRNNQLKELFDRIILRSGVKRVVFISGHEHSQQLFSPEPLLSKSRVHYLVSGSGSQQSYVRKGGDAKFVSKKRGYQKMYLYEDGSVWLEILSVSDDGVSNVMHRTELFDNNKVSDDTVNRTYAPLLDSITVRPTKNFELGKTGRLFVGDQYRDVWKTDIKVPVIDLAEAKGGLTPVKLGGGASSNSLRLSDKEGKEYILRSVVKVYGRFLKSEYKDVVWLDYYGDENSSALPYGTLTIGKMSDAINLPHNNPTLYYLSHQEGLGPYNDLLAEGLYMLENRPDGKKWKDSKTFGFPDDIVSNNDMVKAVSTKASHKVDQKSVLKARLFDMWVHDWDRHADQWRWSKSKEDNLTIYRPIPRDRDWVYFKYDGLIYSFLGKYVERKHSSFKEEISDIEGLNMSPAHFDRANLNALEWREWETIVKQMQLALTDDLIYEALSQMPKEVVPMVREEIYAKLIQRRDDLMKYALEYYKILTNEISIVGTKNNDHITVTPVGADSTRIEVVSHRKKKTDILKYSRTFSNDESEVVRIYGMDGEDELVLDEHTLPFDISFIGGLEKDKVIYTGDKKTNLTVYDTKKGVHIPNKKLIKTKLRDDISNNRYNRYEFQYDAFLPTINFGSTFDEGLWFGGGFIKTYRGFRKEPFASKHTVSVKVAPFKTASILVDYNAVYSDIGIHDIQLTSNIYYHNPDNLNFFGFFNEINNEADAQFNRVKASSYGLDLRLKKAWNQEAISASVGPKIKSYNINTDDDRILENYDLITKEYDKVELYYGGAANITLKAIDSELIPTTGFKFTTDADYSSGINVETNALNIYSDFVFYIPVIDKPNLVLALNTGLAIQYGDSDWYLKPSIGANNHLKSLRNERLRGESIYYFQAELRGDIITFNNKYLPMDIGFTLGYEGVSAQFNDVETKINGISAGIILNIGDIFIIHPYLARAENRNAFGLKLGYKY